MDLRQSYKILGLRFGADMETVKSTFRKRAFEFHPDLHPDDALAAKKFQDLNKAYVHLRKYLSVKEAKKQGGRQAKQRPRATWQTSEAQRKPKYRPERPRTASSRESNEPKSGRKSFAAKQEEVLKDILNDPFARQVFEDIFEKIKGHRPQASPTTQNQIPLKKRNLNLSWDKHSFNLDLSKGFFSGIKKWIGSQLDDFQTIQLPARQLLPGSMVRVRIKRRGKGVQSIEIRLPHTFVVGRPIRIKGQGGKLGPLKGDLYLRFLAV